MTSSSTFPAPHPWLAAAGLALVPAAAFVAGMYVADGLVDWRSVEWTDPDGTAAYVVGFVGVPAMLPLAAARAGWVRGGVLLAMTAVATLAGTLVITIDDAQAGLAVLLVGYLAVPLTVTLWLFRAVSTFRRAAARRAAERAR